MNRVKIEESKDQAFVGAVFSVGCWLVFSKGAADTETPLPMLTGSQSSIM